MKKFFVTKSKNEDFYGVLIYNSDGVLPDDCKIKLTLEEIKQKVTDLIVQDYRLNVPNGNRSILTHIQANYYILNLEEIIEIGILKFALI